MAANRFEIVWRNALPIWARPVEPAAGPLECVKGPEPQREQRSSGSSAIGAARLSVVGASYAIPLSVAADGD